MWPPLSFVSTLGIQKQMLTGKISSSQTMASRYSSRSPMETQGIPYEIRCRRYAPLGTDIWHLLSWTGREPRNGWFSWLFPSLPSCLTMYVALSQSPFSLSSYSFIVWLGKCYWVCIRDVSGQRMTSKSLQCSNASSARRGLAHLPKYR